MGKLLSTAAVVFSVSILYSYGQIKKQFTVESPEDCQTVELHMKAKVGNCYIRPTQNADILNIYSNQDIEEYGHSFQKEMIGHTCFVRLNLETEGQKGVGQMISNQVFGSDEKVTEKLWKVYLTDSKSYSLDLVYGLGSANVDLSGLAVKKLKINTGSADVNVSYASGLENKVEMDTFFVKVDVGSLNVKQLNLSRAKVVLVDVGFGNMYLDFSNKPLVNNHVKGSVGAGNLVVQLPGEEVPVLVKVNESWLCSVSLSKGLQKIAENTFANAAYEKNSANALTFDLDVSLGKIIFREK